MSENASISEPANQETLLASAVEQKSIDSLNTNFAVSSGDASDVADPAAQMFKG